MVKILLLLRPKAVTPTQAAAKGQYVTSGQRQATKGRNTILPARRRPKANT